MRVHIRRGGVYRLVGRLLGPQAGTDHCLRRVSGSGGGQAHGGDHLGADRPSAAQPWLALAAAVIIGREITIASLREWMAEIGQRKQVEVSWLGKIKTSAQMAAIVVLLLAFDVTATWVGASGYVLLYISAALTLWSMINYLRVALPMLISSKKC